MYNFITQSQLNAILAFCADTAANANSEVELEISHEGARGSLHAPHIKMHAAHSIGIDDETLLFKAYYAEVKEQDDKPDWAYKNYEEIIDLVKRYNAHGKTTPDELLKHLEAQKLDRPAIARLDKRDKNLLQLRLTTVLRDERLVPEPLIEAVIPGAMEVFDECLFGSDIILTDNHPDGYYIVRDGNLVDIFYKLRYVVVLAKDGSHKGANTLTLDICRILKKYAFEKAFSREINCLNFINAAFDKQTKRLVGALRDCLPSESNPFAGIIDADDAADFDTSSWRYAAIETTTKDAYFGALEYAKGLSRFNDLLEFVSPLILSDAADETYAIFHFYPDGEITFTANTSENTKLHCAPLDCQKSYEPSYRFKLGAQNKVLDFKTKKGYLYCVTTPYDDEELRPSAVDALNTNGNDIIADAEVSVYSKTPDAIKYTTIPSTFVNYFGQTFHLKNVSVFAVFLTLEAVRQPKTIVVQEGITQISFGSFYQPESYSIDSIPNMTKLILPSTLTTLEGLELPQTLKELVFKGTKEQLKNMILTAYGYNTTKENFLYLMAPMDQKPTEKTIAEFTITCSDGIFDIDKELKRKP